MPNVTIAVTPELKRRMDAMETVNWSGVARRAIERHLTDMEQFFALTKDSKMTEADARELGRIVNAGMAQHYRKEIEELRKTRPELFRPKAKPVRNP